MSKYIKEIMGYGFLREVGQGAYGHVYEGEDKISKQKVAIKCIQRNQIDRNDYLYHLLNSEIDIMKQVEHPNVIKFIDVIKSVHNYYLVLEYCDGGDLAEYVESHEMPEEKCVEFLKQIISGFKIIRQRRIMHRDFKLENVLLHEGKVKIADFGFSKQFHI